MTSATVGNATDALERTTTGVRRNPLGEAVERLASRTSDIDADRVLRLAGPVLLPTGAIVIVLGWYGAANTTRVFLQIPYLISGGLLGLGMMFAGGFLYFARWLTDLLDETRRQASEAQQTSDRTADALERIESLLRATNAAPAVVPAPSASEASVAPRSVPVAATSLVATAKGTMAHRPECRLVAGRATHPVVLDATMGRCQICRPPIS